MIWFTSDTHFFHRNSIFHNNRPYKTVEEMNENLIKNWNRCVKSTDEIYHLGDFSWKTSPTMMKELLEKLNGKKHLILGNHDNEKMIQHLNMFESVTNYKRILLDGYRVILFHYPIADFDCMYHKSIHLYGHVHNNPCLIDMLDKEKYYAYNVGVDTNNYQPISFEEIKIKLNLPKEGDKNTMIY